MPELAEHPFTCFNCGAGFTKNPHMERFLSGDWREFYLANLCWICRRLKASVEREMQEAA